MLTISFSRIKNSQSPLTHIEDDVETREDFLSRSKKLLFGAKNIHVVGDLFYDEPYVTGNFQVSTDLVLPSSRSLKPVNYHLEFSFVENYTQNKPTQEELDDNPDPIVLIDDDTIDLQTAIEDNILIHIPSKILTKEEKEKGVYPKGEDWQVISEKTFEENKKKQINPAFAKLKGLFDEKDN